MTIDVDQQSRTTDRDAAPPRAARPRPVRRLAKGCAAVIATGFVFAPAAAHLVGVREKPIENRAMAAAPSLSDGWSALDAVGPWVSDRLPGRSWAVRANAWLDYHVLGEVPLIQDRSTRAGEPIGSPRALRPEVIRGRGGNLFLYEDFSSACLRGARFDDAIRSMLDLAEVIKLSGRKVAFAVAPNKSSVLTGQLPGSLPTGECATVGMARQAAALDRTRHSLLVPVRRDLIAAAAGDRRPYWRQDTHWNTVGAAVYARSVAERLDPDLARRIEVSYGTDRRVGDLTRMLGLTTTETGTGATVSAGGTVVPDPATDRYDPAEVNYGRQHWTTTPDSGLIQGKSLLIGDSFTYYALGALRPLFADGTFLWTGRASPDEIVAGIKAADTVVIEVVERSVDPAHMFARTWFHQKVAAALKRGS